MCKVAQSVFISCKQYFCEEQQTKYERKKNKLEKRKQASNINTENKIIQGNDQLPE